MSTQYPGAVLSGLCPEVTGGSLGVASGIWTLTQVMQNSGNWPSPASTTRALWAWGENSYGQLGLGDTAYRSSPIQIGAITDWLKLSGGYYHSAAINDAGKLFSWGRNNKGQLGLGDVVNRSTPSQVGILTNWLSVSCGGYITSALKVDGSLWTWGDNLYGSLGIGNTYLQSSPVQVGMLTTWLSVSSGKYHILATKNDNSLWTWGLNWYGQLGMDDQVYRSTPTQLGVLTSWLEISSGLYNSLALKADHTMWSWGYNWYGQLGLGDIVYRSSPIQVGADSTWLKLSAGAYSSMVKKTDHSLWTWGSNFYGELGQGTGFTTNSSSIPGQVGSGTNWSSGSKSAMFTLAIKTDGTLWSWGWNQYGNLALNDAGGTHRSSPVQVGADITWKSVHTGEYHALAIKTDNTLWAWGSNFYGELGINEAVYSAHRSSPVQVGADTTWFSASCGSFTSMAIKTNGTLWSWGDNSFGQLGTPYSNLSSPVQVGSDTTWSSVSCGDYTVMAIKVNGTLWAWGRNEWGQLGINDTLFRASPVQVGFDTSWSSVSCGYISLAIKVDGTLWAWGWNNYGQLGLGDIISRSSPVQVGNDATWKSVNAGGYYTASAIKTDNTLWMWGINNSGELGQGDLILRSSPVQVGNDGSWSSLFSGIIASSLVIKTDGALWAWGFNYYGQLGNGLGASKYYSSSPAQVGALTTWQEISSGKYHKLATHNDNSLWAWGQNWAGSLGISDALDRSSPIQVGSLTTWLSISGGGYHSLAIGAPGTSFSPSISVMPVMSGSFILDGLLSVTDGVWLANPSPTITYNWMWEDTTWLGSNSTYTVQAADLAHTIYCTVVATNDQGTGAVTVAMPTLPANSVAPVVTGTPNENETLTSTSGTWSGYPTPVLSYQWKATGVNVGTNSNTYVLSFSDVGKHMTCTVSATNIFGTVEATSASLGPVLTAPYGLMAWGMNGYNGSLGINTSGNNTSVSSPVQVTDWTYWLSLSAGYYFNIAVRSDNTLWAWGSNSYGCLGIPDSQHHSSPTQVGALTNWLQGSAGGYHSMAVKTDGTLWAWGTNSHGELGLNNTVSHYSPIQVGVDTDWSIVTCSSGRNQGDATAAIKTNNTLWTWGANGDNSGNVVGGILGLNRDWHPVSSPMQVGAETNWRSVSAGFNFMLATKLDGSLWTWGNGNLWPAYRVSSPVQIGASLTWDLISAGSESILATQIDGTLWSAGTNWSGEVGNGDTIATSEPIQIGALTMWSLAAAGNNNSMGLRQNGTLWAWGWNGNGQLGDNTIYNRSSPVQVGLSSEWLKVSTNITTIASKTGALFAPVSAGTPEIIGSPIVTETLSVRSPWLANPRATLTYVWHWEDNTIIGTASSYPVVLGDLGHSIYCVVTATNSEGSASDTSTSTSSILYSGDTLWTWGGNEDGELGLGDAGYGISRGATSRSSPNQVGTTSSWLSISAGYYYVTALKVDHSLWTWGDNSYGELGHGDWIFKSSPVQVGATTNWFKVHGGGWHINAIKNDGTLWTWGGAGQGLGLGDLDDRISPCQVGTDTWIEVESGHRFTVGVKSDGTLWSWGRQYYGELGTNTPSPGSPVFITNPTQIGALTSWLHVCVAAYSAIAVKNDRTLWTWGWNTSGILGLGDTVNRSSPVQIGSLTDWLEIASGNYFTFIIKQDNSLWAWGVNWAGQLGIGTIIDRSTAIQVGALTDWLHITGGNYQSLAVKTTGTLWSWGWNDFGELGLGNTVYRSSPTQVGAETDWINVSMGARPSMATRQGAYTFAPKSVFIPEIIGLPSVGVELSCSSGVWTGNPTPTYTYQWQWDDLTNIGTDSKTYTVAYEDIGHAIHCVVTATNSQGSTSATSASTGTVPALGYGLMTWGGGRDGSTGLSDIVNRSSPVQLSAVTNWLDIAAGYYHSALVDSNNRLWTWGTNRYGQLGHGDLIYRSSPVQVGSLTNWLKTASSSIEFTIASKTDGTLWAWGYNGYGELGQGDHTYIENVGWHYFGRSSPTQVGSSNTWSKVAAGYYQSFAVKSNGTLWAWGKGFPGSIGDGTTNSRSSPVQIGTDTDWADVSSNLSFIGGIKTNGTLWRWGPTTSYYYPLASPLQIDVGTTWTSLSVGANFMLALKSEGSLWSYGFNDNGQLGLGDTAYRGNMTQIGNDLTWKDIAAGGAHSVAIKTDGTMWSWGHNWAGALGLGDSVFRSSPVQIGVLTTWDKAFSSADSFAIKLDGSLWSWGESRWGSLGNSYASTSVPTQVGSSYNWSSVFPGNQSDSMALQTDGTLWHWGGNSDGMFEEGSSAIPIQLGALTTWQTAGAGFNHYLAVNSPGTLWTSGGNRYGQLGLGDADYTYVARETNRPSPTQVGLLADWSQNFTCMEDGVAAIKSDGTLWTWGYNGWEGSLGLGDINHRSSPTQVGALTNWRLITSGMETVLAIKENGSLWSWGSGWIGTLGNNTNIEHSSPVQVGSLTDWLQISAAYYHASAIRSNGTLWSWGGDWAGALGIDDTIYHSSPIQVGALTNWKYVSAGQNHTVATKTDGSLWIWGVNYPGTLGLNNTVYHSTPVQIGTQTNWLRISAGGYTTLAIAHSAPFAPTSTVLPTISGVASVGSILTATTGTWIGLPTPTFSYQWQWEDNTNIGTNTNTYTIVSGDVGHAIHCVITATNTQGSVSKETPPVGIVTLPVHTFWSTGANWNGELGLGNTTPHNSPVQMGALTNWLTLAAGYLVTFGILSDNTLWSWGYNSSGQLGLGDTSQRLSPIQVGALTDWISVAASYELTAAIKTDGSLWTWGHNTQGELGHDNIVWRSSPVQVGILTDWSTVKVGSGSVVAIKTNNTLWSWGSNWDGRLGLNDQVYRSSPVQVGSSTWSMVAAGDQFVVAVGTDGSLWTWGWNSYGQLGINDTTNKSSPVQVGILTTWQNVAASRWHSVATKANNSLWAWGSNSFSTAGALGQDDTVNRSSPTQIGSDLLWNEISCGIGHTIATKADHSLWTWGENSAGQLGIGNTVYKSSPVQVGSLTLWEQIAGGAGPHTFAIRN